MSKENFNSQNQPQNTESEQPIFAVEQIYTKDISFESPNTPEIFREEWKPELNLDMNVTSNKLEENVYEVILRVTASTKIKDKDVFVAEVNEAGIFSVKNFNETEIHRLLGSYCPNILYPFARELITNLVSRAGFPRLYLSPVNFEALYNQQMEQAQEEGETTETDSTTKH